MCTDQALDIDVDDDSVPSGRDGIVENLVKQHGVKLVKNSQAVND